MIYCSVLWVIFPVRSDHMDYEMKAELIGKKCGISAGTA